MRADLVALESVVAVYDLGTVVDAAAARGYSAAAISRQITRVQRRLGFRLFEPRGRTIVPTSHAARLVDIARPVLAEVRMLERDLQAMLAAGGAEPAAARGQDGLQLAPLS